MNFTAFEEKIEFAIRNGNRAEARSYLKELRGQSYTRARATTFANFARRCGMLQLAQQIMEPIVRPKVSRGEKVTPDESAAYALILVGLGAVAEGVKLLNEANAESSEVILAQAFAATKSWDYETAEERLLKFERCAGPGDYQRMTASVNLAASQIALGKHAEASIRIDLILNETRKRGWHLLHKNARELATQLAVLRSDWKAFDIITKSVEQTKESEFNLDDFFMSKWSAIAELNRTNGAPVSISRLAKVRAQAVLNHHFETVRDCDYQRAVVARDENLALHVYFGTPYKSFRSRIATTTSSWLEIPDSYVWKINSGRDRNSKISRVFDLDQGIEVGTKIETAKGRSLHSALKVLSSDFYRPFQMGSLLSEMYPDEQINSNSSPKRAAYLMHRLRRWFEVGNIPLQVLNDGHGYRLHSSKSYGILISNSETKTATAGLEVARRLMFKKLRDETKSRVFSIHDVAKHLAISERSARYFVNWAVNLNLILRVGSGRITQYRIS